MNKFEEQINGNYKFEMGKYIQEGWEIFKKGAGSFIGFTFLYFIISFVIAVIPFVNLLGTFIQYALVAGIFIYCRRLLQNREEFGDFFEGFSVFGQIALFILVIFLFLLPVLVLMVIFVFPPDVFTQMLTGNVQVFDTYNMQEPGVMFLISYLLFIVATIYIGISYFFALPLIADEKMGFWDAMETSRKTVGNKFFSFFGLAIVIMLILVAGTVVTCGLGLLVALPLFFTVQFSAYDRILKPQRDTIHHQIEEFGQNKGDINTEAQE